MQNAIHADVLKRLGKIIKKLIPGDYFRFAI